MTKVITQPQKNVVFFTHSSYIYVSLTLKICYIYYMYACVLYVCVYRQKGRDRETKKEPEKGQKVGHSFIYTFQHYTVSADPEQK